jgi:hypothetical protein
LLVEVGGVGYVVQVPLSTQAAVGELHAEVTLLIHRHVREEARRKNLGRIRVAKREKATARRARRDFFVRWTRAKREEVLTQLRLDSK